MKRWFVVECAREIEGVSTRRMEDFMPIARDMRSDQDMATYADGLLLALESMADRSGQQAGAVVLLVRLLAQERLISSSDAKQLVRLLAADAPEAQDFVTARVARRNMRMCGRYRKPYVGKLAKARRKNSLEIARA